MRRGYICVTSHAHFIVPLHSSVAMFLIAVIFTVYKSNQQILLAKSMQLFHILCLHHKRGFVVSQVHLENQKSCVDLASCKIFVISASDTIANILDLQVLLMIKRKLLP